MTNSNHKRHNDKILKNPYLRTVQKSWPWNSQLKCVTSASAQQRVWLNRLSKIHNFNWRRWGSSLPGLQPLDPLLSPPSTPVYTSSTVWTAAYSYTVRNNAHAHVCRLPQHLTIQYRTHIDPPMHMCTPADKYPYSAGWKSSPGGMEKKWPTI